MFCGLSPLVLPKDVSTINHMHCDSTNNYYQPLCYCYYSTCHMSAVNHSGHSIDTIATQCVYVKYVIISLFCKTAAALPIKCKKLMRPTSICICICMYIICSYNYYNYMFNYSNSSQPVLNIIYLTIF